MRALSTNRRYAATIVLGGLSGMLSWILGQDMQRGPVSNPHGPLKLACGNCHTSVSWAPLRASLEFDHNRETRYPLLGLHKKVACRECHANLVFQQASVQCAECHADLHRRQFGARCENCHTVRGWQVTTKGTREHSPRFQLTGGHAAVDCEACHRGAAAGQYAGLSIQCGSCHMNDFLNAKAINHQAAGFPVTCGQCHSVDSWLAVNLNGFNHANFGFALVGVHATLPCVACHVNNQFQGIPADCYSCHVKDYTSAKNPDHVAAGFPTTCSLCHDSISWLDSTFNHVTVGFALTGAHVTTPCAQCHLNGQFANAPTQCQGCHLADFNGTTNPNHVSAGFPQDCSLCHTTTNWLGAVFDHSTTGFALTGAHAPLACAACHTNGQFTALPTTCASCHLTDYNNATNPNHITSGYPQTCDVCHSTTAWSPASFNHNNTPFPLTGAHVTVACTACHINNTFAGTPTDCYSCHKTDYTTTNNPNHVAANFPTTCATCHTTTAWTGATFTHSQFPIYSGTHANAWTTCADCHTNASNFQMFSCITCHTHTQAATDPHHTGVKGYVYAATTCYSCHPNGTGGH